MSEVWEGLQHAGQHELEEPPYCGRCTGEHETRFCEDGEDDGPDPDEEYDRRRERDLFGEDGRLSNGTLLAIIIFVVATILVGVSLIPQPKDPPAPFDYRGRVVGLERWNDTLLARLDVLEARTADLDARLRVLAAAPTGLSGPEVRALIEMLAPAPTSPICPEDPAQPCQEVPQ